MEHFGRLFLRFSTRIVIPAASGGTFLRGSFHCRSVGRQFVHPITANPADRFRWCGFVSGAPIDEQQELGPDSGC